MEKDFDPKLIAAILQAVIVGCVNTAALKVGFSRFKAALVGAASVAFVICFAVIPITTVCYYNRQVSDWTEVYVASTGSKDMDIPEDVCGTFHYLLSYIVLLVVIMMMNL